MNRLLISLLSVGLCVLTEGRASAGHDMARPSGCVVDCPTCNPGQPCPMRPCRLICPDGATPCGVALCEHGDVCCNASCGICTAPGEGCSQEVCAPDRCAEHSACDPDFHWSAERCACVANESGSCRDSSDCELLSDYCSGCDCRALAADDPQPGCGLPGVRCFADPCLNQRAACVGGRCEVVRDCVEKLLCTRGYRWSLERCTCVADRSLRLRRKHQPQMPHAPHPPW